MKSLISECLAWFPDIIVKLVVGHLYSLDIPDLPDDIVIEILSRLPADCLMKCRRVCKKWKELTSTTSFADLHLKRGASFAPPSFFVQQMENHLLYVRNEFDYRICDADEQNNIFSRRRIYTKVNTQWFHAKVAKIRPHVSSSVDGLLLFQTSLQRDRQVHILNPLTKELVCVHAPFNISRPCGIYRDPSTHTYKLLLIYENGGLSYYFTASLKTMSIKKLEYISWWGNTLQYARMIHSEGSIHWFVANNRDTQERDCNYKIMVFSTKTEEFRLLPHPGDASICHEQHFFNMELLETRGKLWQFHVSVQEIQVWVLKDHANWVWDRRYTVSLDWSKWRFPFRNNNLWDTFSAFEVKILGIINDVELLICWHHRGMFWYNLERKTIIKASIFERNLCCELLYTPRCSCSYTKTLVRLAPLVQEKQVPSSPFYLKLETFQA